MLELRQGNRPLLSRRFALIAAIPARFRITVFQSVNQTATPKFRPMNNTLEADLK